MLGLFPPGTSDVKLTEWQKKNVKPPYHEGITQKEIDEIGDYPLKDGFVPFDIFSEYKGADHVMDINGQSCTLYQTIREKAHNSDFFKKIKERLVSDLNHLVLNKTVD